MKNTYQINIKHKPCIYFEGTENEKNEFILEIDDILEVQNITKDAEEKEFKNVGNNTTNMKLLKHRVIYKSGLQDIIGATSIPHLLDLLKRDQPHEATDETILDIESIKVYPADKKSKRDIVNKELANFDSRLVDVEMRLLQMELNAKPVIEPKKILTNEELFFQSIRK